MITDYIILAVVITGAILHFKKGFVKSVIGLVDNLGSAILSVIVINPVFLWAKSSSFYVYLVDVISKYIPLDKFAQNLISGGEGMFSKLFASMFEDFATLHGAEIVRGIAENIAGFVFKAALFIILFLIFKLMFKIAEKIAGAIMSLPLFNIINKILGIVVGGVKYFLIIYALIGIAVVLLPKGAENIVYNLFENSKLSGVLLHNNAIIKFFS